MYSSRMMMKPLVLACSLALAACSSSDDPAATATPTTTTISGLAAAPEGGIAQFEQDKPWLVAATELLFPAAYAGITGLQPVGNALVELIRIDDGGNPDGEVLASSYTSITGEYSLALPSGVSLAGNLIVRITGNSGASMGAMVVEQVVDINPISQYVLDKFVDDDTLVLADLALNEVVALTDRVEEFDLTADPTADLSTMLAQLEAEVGELVDTEIAIINATPDDGTAAAALAGTWNSVEFGLGMHDSENEDYGTFNFEVFSEGFNLTAGTNPGEINVEIPVSTFLDAWTNVGTDNSGFVSLYHETSLGDEVENLTALIDDGGNIVVEYPFEEDFQTVSIGDPISDPDGDGPDYGWRWPSGSVALKNVGDDNTMVYSEASAGVRYFMTDTDDDGINDAIDPNAKAGDETEMFLGLMLKQGTGMSTSSLMGDYGIVTMAVGVDTTPQSPLGSVDSSVGAVYFDGAGSASVATGAFDDYGFERLPNAFNDVVLTDSVATDGGFGFPYTVTDTGLVTLDTDNDGPNAQDLQGWSNADASIVGLLNVTTSGAEPSINSVSKEMAVLLKLPSAAPDLAGAVFKLFPIAYGAEETGLTELDTLGINSALTFNSDASAATAEFVLRGFERATDIAAVEAIADPDELPFEFTVSVEANGAVEMSYVDPLAGENTTLKGFLSADGNMMVLRYLEKDDSADQTFRALGLVLAVRQ